MALDHPASFELEVEQTPAPEKTLAPAASNAKAPAVKYNAKVNEPLLLNHALEFTPGI